MTSYAPPVENLALFDTNVFKQISGGILSGSSTITDTSITKPLTAFGEVMVSQLTPVAHLVFNYNIINNQESIIIASGGTVTASSGLLNVSSGNGLNNYAYCQSKKTLIYRPGQGCNARFTALFTTPTLTTGQQFAGIGNVITSTIQDAVGFGYNNGSTEFGIFYYSTSSGSPIKTFIPQNAWNMDTFNGTTSKNTINPIYGNVYQIQYQYLGFGDIFFSIENKNTGLFELVHRIKFPNQSLVPSFGNPTMPLLWYAYNNSGSASVTVKSGSGAMFLEGQYHDILDDYKYTYDYYTSVANNAALKNIFAMRCITTLNSKQNTGLIQLTSLSIGSSSTNACNGILQLILCPLNTDIPLFTRWIVTPTFTNITNVANQSISEVSGPLYGITPILGTLATTATGLGSYSNSLMANGGGFLVYSLAFASPSSQVVDISHLHIFVSAGELISFAVKASNACDIALSVTWSESW